MTQAITVILPIPPSVNAMYRNVLRVGRVKTAAYKTWQAEALQSAIAHGAKGQIIGPYAIHIEIDRPDLKRRRDLGNYLKAIEDFCVQAHYVADDSLCQRIKMAWTDRVPDRPGPVRVWLIATGEGSEEF
jgi:Holliday junction resolvase RusA-like endonuclease